MTKIKGQIAVKRLTGRLMLSPLGMILPALQDKTVIPTAAEQIIEGDDGFDGLEKVTIPGDENFIPKNIRNGVTIWGVLGISAGSPFTVSAVAIHPIIYEAVAPSEFSVDFETSAAGVLYEEAET